MSPHELDWVPRKDEKNRRMAPVITWEDGGISMRDEDGNWWVRFLNGDIVPACKEHKQKCDNFLKQQ